MNENTPSYSISIPVFVLEDRTISPTAKLLYGVIDSFLRRTGVCYASNARLAEEVAGCSERTVSRCVSELKDAGYINVGLLPKTAEKAQVRKITLVLSTGDGQEGRQICLPPTTDLSTPHDKIGEGDQGPCTPILSCPHDKIGEIVLSNNTEGSKEKESKKEKEKSAFDPAPVLLAWIGSMDMPRDDKNALWLAVRRFLENRKVLKKPYKSKGAVTALCNRLRRISGDDVRSMIDALDRATDNGWQSVYAEQVGCERRQTEGQVYEQW